MRGRGGGLVEWPELTSMPPRLVDRAAGGASGLHNARRRDRDTPPRWTPRRLHMRSRSTCRSPPTAGRWCIMTDARLAHDGGRRLDAMTAAALKRVPFRTTADRMMTLAIWLELGRRPASPVPGAQEAVSHRDLRLPRRVAACSRPIPPVGRCPSDPYQVEAIQDFAPGCARDRGLSAMTDARVGGTTGLISLTACAADPISSRIIKDLPAPAPFPGAPCAGHALLTGRPHR